VPVPGERLDKAPINEALIDFRVSLPKTVSIADLEKLHEPIKDRFPTKKARRQWQVELKQEENTHSTRDLGVDGFLFTSADKDAVVQFRMDGFTYSKLRPYDTWDAMLKSAQPLWEKYRDFTKPVEVTRIATRFINAIEIPETQFDLDDYFTAAPRMPKNVPDRLGDFFSRVAVIFQEEQATGIVHFVLGKSSQPNTTQVILDIDVFQEKSFNSDDPEIISTLNKLREIKNRIFFGSITDKAKELFKL
jgi:uncharacterized protein (TIGR04255 family)